jgi:hypothetical protein
VELLEAPEATHYFTQRWKVTRRRRTKSDCDILVIFHFPKNMVYPAGRQQNLTHIKNQGNRACKLNQSHFSVPICRSSPSNNFVDSLEETTRSHLMNLCLLHKVDHTDPPLIARSILVTKPVLRITLATTRFT